MIIINHYKPLLEKHLGPKTLVVSRYWDIFSCRKLLIRHEIFPMGTTRMYVPLGQGISLEILHVMISVLFCLCCYGLWDFRLLNYFYALRMLEVNGYGTFTNHRNVHIFSLQMKHDPLFN